MAKLRVFQNIENSDYVFLFNVDLASLSSEDKALMAKYGEPEVDFGGNFLDVPNGFDFTLPSKLVKVVAGMPHKEIFTITAPPWSTEDGKTEAEKLQFYREQMILRFTTAFTRLRENTDTFTNEYVTTI